MPSQFRSRVVLALSGLVVVAGVAAAWFYYHRSPGTLSNAGPRPFQECATEVGITWRMNFLPNEQGETFKINLYDHGCGLAIGDFDGDGFDDIYFCNQLGRNALYRNKGDGTFEDVTDQAGVGLGDRICVAATWADYDNDGKPDLYVTSTRGGNVLFKNLGGGKFKDVTKEAGLILIAHSQTAVFFDYDGDGYLDLLVTNTAQWTANTSDPSKRYYPGVADLGALASSPIEHNVLYHNNGDGTFTDVTEKSGLKGKGWGGDVSVFDYDGDGQLDILVTNMFGASQLYHNNGNGTFTDVTQATLGRTSWGAIGSKAFDYDNDGRLDLLIVDMHSDMWVPAFNPPALVDLVRRNPRKKYRGVTGGGSVLDPLKAEEVERGMARTFHIRYNEVVFGNTLFHNRGGGRFEEVSDRAGLETWWPWGIATGDFNNDGYEDVFLPAGMGYPFFYWPNSLMMNNGNGTFTDRAAELGIEPPPRGINLPEPIVGKPAVRSSRCAVTADFRGVGLLDIVTNNFNDQPYFFQNHFPRRNYVAFRLHGAGPPRSNRDAVGAVVRIYRGDKVLTRQVQGAGGYLSQASPVLHFGLGDSPAIDRVEVTWPSGLRQELKDVRINNRNDVTEPSGPRVAHPGERGA